MVKKKKGNSNPTGSRGEAFVELTLQTPISGKFLFDVVNLGEKWPTIDLYVELREGHYAKAFCFFQVKTTGEKRDAQGRLPCSVNKADINRLQEFHAPCYIVGVDASSPDPGKLKGYLLSPSLEQGAITKIPSSFPLQENLKNFYDEVMGFWKQMDVLTRKKYFTSRFSL